MDLYFNPCFHLVSTNDQDWDISDDSGHNYRIFFISTDGAESRIKPAKLECTVNTVPSIEYLPKPVEEGTLLERFLDSRMAIK
jgi:hypothetical protein